MNVPVELAIVAAGLMFLAGLAAGAVIAGRPHGEES